MRNPNPEITIEYDLISGTFSATSNFTKGTTRFIGSQDKMPDRLWNFLTLLRREVESGALGIPRNRSYISLDEMQKKIADYEARHGVTICRPQGQRAKPRLTLADLGLEDIL